MVKYQTFKEYWEAKRLITLKEYLNKYVNVSILEQRILQNPYNEWDWDNISGNTKDISLNFIKEFTILLNWDKISKRNDLTEEFINSFNYNINFKLIQYDKLSIYFIREYRDRLDWDKLSQLNNLSEYLYNEFQNFINWEIISKKYLSENFIYKFQNKVNWDYISGRTDLSEQFLIDFSHKLNYNKLNESSLIFLVNRQKYINKIKKWYKNVIRERNKYIVLDKVICESKKNILIKSVYKSNSNLIIENKKNKDILCILILFIFIFLYFYQNV